MIEEAKTVVARWSDNVPGNDPDIQAGCDWMLRLSRGECEQHNYWECIAEDSEEAGDWPRAIEAYRKILDLSDLDSLKNSMANSAIAAIQRLLGNDRAALASYEAATAIFLRSDSRVLWRHRLVNQVFQLIRMGHVGRARILIRRGLKTDEAEFVDHLGVARLQIASARYELAVQQCDRAAQSLRLAWDGLDAFARFHGDDNEWVRQATGIQFAHATWWRTEALRRRMVGDAGGEIEAFQQAVEKTRLCFDPGGWHRPWHELALMRLLLRIADAYERASKPTDAAASNAEADEIFIRRKFPEPARLVQRDNNHSTWFEFLRRRYRSLRRTE